MARFAGDVFNIPLEFSNESAESVLADYFPELRSIKRGSKPQEQTEDSGARLFRGAKAVPSFIGSTKFEQSEEQRAAPQFFGFGTMVR